MSAPRGVEYLDIDDLIDLTTRLIGDPPPIRDVGLLASAVARPPATAFGQDAYPDLVTKAAALLLSAVGNPALIDGNERLGWLATSVFLGLNGVDVTGIGNDDVYDLVMDVVAGAGGSVDDLARRLRSLIEA